MATLDEMLAQMAKIQDELTRMQDDPSITEDQDGNYRDTLVAEWQRLDGETKPLVERMQKIKAITSTAIDPANREDAAPAVVRSGGGPDLYSRTRRDPFGDLEEVRRGRVEHREMIGRALDGIEHSEKRGWLQHDGAEEATRKAQGNYAVSRQLLLTGGDDYLEAFRTYLTNPRDFEAQRALTNGTGSLGYMLPFVLDPTIILNNNGSANPWRRLSRTEMTTSNTWNGVTSAGVNAAFLAEGAAASDNSPTVGQLQITPVKAAAWVFGSVESIDDSDLATQLPGLFSDARDRLESAAFATGDGSSAPQGVITALGTASYAGSGIGGTVTGTAAEAVLLGGLAAPAPRWRQSNKFAWAAAITYLNKIRTFDTSGGGGFWANLTSGTPASLLGYPVFEASAMSSTTATAATGTTGSAVVLVGDFNQYVIVDRVGATIVFEPMVTSQATATVGMPTGQNGWFMFWRVGAKVAVPTAFAYLQP